MNGKESYILLYIHAYSGAIKVLPIKILLIRYALSIVALGVEKCKKMHLTKLTTYNFHIKLMNFYYLQSYIEKVVA